MGQVPADLGAGHGVGQELRPSRGAAAAACPRPQLLAAKIVVATGLETRYSKALQWSKADEKSLQQRHPHDASRQYPAPWLRPVPRRERAAGRCCGQERLPAYRRSGRRSEREMSASFTPGPWVAEGDDQEQAIFRDHPRQLIADVYDDADAARKANARLIAAAP